MKSVCFSGRKLSRLCVPCRKPLPATPPEPMAILAWVMFQPAPSASDSGLRKVITRRLLIVVQHEAPGQRHGGGDAAPDVGAIHHQESPARNSSDAPSATRISVVPRLGCISNQHRGHRRSSQAEWRRRSGLETSSTLRPCRITRQRQHQRDLHQLGGLQLERSQRDPALGAKADMARHFHRDQQAGARGHRRDRRGSSRSGCRPCATATAG